MFLKPFCSCVNFGFVFSKPLKRTRKAAYICGGAWPDGGDDERGEGKGEDRTSHYRCENESCLKKLSLADISKQAALKSPSCLAYEN